MSQITVAISASVIHQDPEDPAELYFIFGVTTTRGQDFSDRAPKNFPDAHSVPRNGHFGPYHVTQVSLQAGERCSFLTVAMERDSAFSHQNLPVISSWLPNGYLGISSFGPLLRHFAYDDDNRISFPGIDLDEAIGAMHVSFMNVGEDVGNVEWQTAGGVASMHPNPDPSYPPPMNMQYLMTGEKKDTRWYLTFHLRRV